MKCWARWRPPAKIFLPFACLILATLLSTLSLINSAVSHQMENNLRTQLVVTGEAFRRLVSERARQLTADASLLAADFALKRAMATYDRETLATVAVNCRKRLDVDQLWITDESGNLLADASGRQRIGQAIGSLLPLHEAITQEQGAAALNDLDGTLFVFAAVPVLAPDPIGFLLAGSAIDDNSAREFERQIGSAVTIATATRVFATSWPAAERAAFLPGDRLGAAAFRHRAPGTFLVRRGDERLLSLLLPIESSLSTPLFALLQQSYDRTLQPLQVLRRRVALIGVAALAGALIVGALAAVGIAVTLRSEGDDVVAAPEPRAAEIQVGHQRVHL